MSRADPVKVGYCIDSFGIGGTELNAVRTIEAIDRSSYDITVFHFAADGPLRARYEALGVRMVRIPISNLYGLNTLRQGLHFARMLRIGRITVVHTHDLYSNIFAVPFARIVARCQVIASRRWLQEAPRPGLVTLNRCSYRWATRVLGNSPAVIALLSREGVPAGKLFELPNFLEDTAFERVDRGAFMAQRRAWGVPDGSFVIGVVARLAPVKNHAMLLRAAKLLDDDNHLVLIGDGPERAALESLAANLGIAPRVHFVGQLLAERNLHQFFDVSVLCSSSEGFPNTIIEALAAGTAVVATPVGGVIDVVTANETGLLVAVNDADALAASLRLLREDTGLRARLGETGRTLVRGRYHRTAVIPRLQDLYSALCLERRP